MPADGLSPVFPEHAENQQGWNSVWSPKWVIDRLLVPDPLRLLTKVSM